MSLDRQRAFEDWKRKALDRGLLETAVQFGAKLKKSGREHVGPCPTCSGRDRFSVNETKGAWVCRGFGGGHDAISLAIHIGGLSFTQACEVLTGEPPPNGRREALSDEEKASIDKRRRDGEAAQRRREAEEKAYQDDTREAALMIWNECHPFAGTQTEIYLTRRGLPLDCLAGLDCIRHHCALPYPGLKGRFPAMVCRVDDVCGDLTAIWRTYLTDDGTRLDVENPKLGLGPAAGGAVRIGGVGPKLGLAEGVESALGAWCLTGRKYPVWATLSTSGLIGFEVPLGVSRATIFPDGDRSIRKHEGEFIPSMPAGRKAAQTLKARLIEEGVACVLAAEPGPKRDYLDLWRAHAMEAA